MNITDVRIKPIEKDNSRVKAIASITIDGEFVVHDIKIVDGQNGLFVAMPSKKDGNGDFKDVAHPIKTSTRTAIKDAVLAQYEAIMSE